MTPTYTIHERKDWQLPWEVRSSIRNENAEFRHLGIKPDHYIASFRTKEEAYKYVELCCN